MKYIAKLINIPYIKVYEVATLYVQLISSWKIPCSNSITPCMIRGAYDLVDVLKKKINENQNELSEKGICSWTEVECLGACINAPMMQINDDYYEDLNVSDVEKIIEKIMNNEKPLPGSYNGRKNSEPVNNRKTLINNKNA